MNLEELGWNSFFCEHFRQYEGKGLSPARISSQEKNMYTAYSEFDELTGRVSGKFRYNAAAKSDFPTIGDWVAVKVDLNMRKMIIRGLLPRKSGFFRTMLDNDRIIGEQAISANVDTVFLVSGLDTSMSTRLIERYITQVSSSGAELVIVLNKTDLCKKVEKRIQEAELIAKEIPIYAVSALNREGLEPLREYLSTGKTVTLVGSSGVGKSTIINSLLGTERQMVGEVREYDAQGRHITTRRELIILPTGGMIIDNPGMRFLSLSSDEESLDESFGDIKELALHCKFKNCRHRNEIGCAVLEALENGTLSKERYESYLRLQRELRHLAIRKEEKALRNSRKIQRKKKKRRKKFSVNEEEGYIE